MNPLANLLGTEVQGILKNLTGFIDGLVVTKEDKAKIIERVNDADNQIQISINDSLTQRHQADMNSDSWLSKNIRPMVLVFTIAAFVIMAVFDGNIGQFEIQESYRNTLKNWGELAFMFYFGSRGLEKIVSRAPDLTEKLFKKRNRKRDSK